MARPRKPTASLEAAGSFQRHPERKAARSGEPTPTGSLGEPPEGLEGEEKAIWRELATLLPPGVAGNSDRFAFEELVRLKAGARRRRLNAGEQGLLLSYLSKFGLTPSDRSKVSAKDDSAQDPLEAFLSRKAPSEITQ